MCGRVLLLLFLLHLAWAQSHVSVVEITLTTTVNTVTTPPPLSAQYTDGLAFRTSLLNSTNFFRYEHSATFVYWNQTLASYAQSYSEKCEWQHSGGSYGENLASGYPNVTVAVDAWGNERKNYDFSSTNPTGFSEKTGHFTQLVWQSTFTIGCGWTDCTGRNDMGGVFVVCEYYPAGNIVGEDNRFFKQNVANERKEQDKGFDEAAATIGATGGTPPTTGSAASATATTDNGTSRIANNGRGVVTLLLVWFLLPLVLGMEML